MPAQYGCDPFGKRAIEAMESWFGMNNKHPSDFSDLNSFNDVARAALQIAGVRVPIGDIWQLYSRAMSSSDFPNVLSDVATKILQESFRMQPRTFQYWMEPWPVSNFRAVEIPRVGWPGNLPELNPDGGEYTYLDVTDGGESAQLKSYGGMLGFTRKTLVNDDKGFFRSKARAGGQVASRTISRLAYACLLSPGNLSDGVAFFHADRGNLLTGTSGTTYALDADSLGAAVQALREQTDDSGNYLELEPKYLLVPPALETTAWSLCNSLALPGQGNDESNIYKEKFGLVPVVAPQLASSSLGGNDLDWFLFADPKVTPACFAMLCMGKDWPEPFVDQEAQWSSDTIELKIRLDCEPQAVNPIGCVKVDVYN